MCELLRIAAVLDLADGGVGSVVVFQLHDDYGITIVKHGDESHVGKALARRQLLHRHEHSSGSYIGITHKGAQCLLVVVETRGGVLAVERVQCLRHIFLVHGESGLQEYV